MPHRQILRAGVLQNVRAPDQLAGGRVEAAQLASGAEREHETVSPGRRRPRTFAAPHPLA